MIVTKYIIDCLERTPVILVNILTQIPGNLFKTRRVPNKWSVHEQVCHLLDAQRILKERFIRFEQEENPVIKSYEPSFEQSADHYLNMNMKEALDQFPQLRADLVKILRGFDEKYWQREGRHEVFQPYNTQILLTHALNVDYSHLFSIGQLGLTKPGLEEGILTIL